jgi:3'(2'), 5'-bisphosphate nucleotidase
MNSSHPRFTQEMIVAQAAALRASRIILDHYAEFQRIPDAPAEISTLADRQGQDVILETLATAFPNDGFIAEEATPTLQQLRQEGERVWVIDPIDGTRGFARKNDEFSIMIGLVVNSEPVLGVVLEPVLGRMTWASKGQGCASTQGPPPTAGHVQSCHVSSVSSLAEATLLQSRSKKDSGTSPVQPIGKIVYTYSAGIKLAMLARGEADLYIGLHPYHVWDLCAGHILLSEAGGQLTDAQGQPVTYPPRGPLQVHGTIASNGHLHAAAQVALRP